MIILLRCALNVFLICFFAVASCEEQWKIDEQRVLNEAQRENLPVVAVFMRADECPWSYKLKEDVLRAAPFITPIAYEVILWEISLGKEDEDTALRQKYGVKECPQIVLLDPKGKEFARMGYLPISPGEYALAILSLFDDFQRVCLALDAKTDAFDEEEWKELYVSAKKFSVPFFKQLLLEQGLKREKGNFFHVEKYAVMLERNKLKNPETLKFKNQLLKRDPDNSQGTHFKVAVLEFQKRSSPKKLKGRIEKALVPLFDYMKKFKDKDKENLWKIEMMIAEFFYAKQRIPLAIEHAEKSLELSPDSHKPQVLDAISYMKGSG